MCDFYAWVLRKLGEVIKKLYNGQTPSRNHLDFWNGDIPWLTSGELNHSVVLHTTEHINIVGKKSSNLKIVPSGTFVMAITGLEASGTRGNSAILGLDTTINQSVMALFPNSLLNTNFLFQWYQKIGDKYGIRYTQGTKQQSYNSELIKILPITMPYSLKEQQAIGLLLKKIDDLIALQQRKIDTLKLLKKALLQQMFPENGKDIPRVKFNRFSGKWEQRKLGEITNIKTGASDLQDAVEGGLYPFFVRSENVKRSMRYIFDGEAILIPGEGKIGEIYHYINGKFDYHQRVYKISDFKKEQIDGKYILFYMKRNFKKHALRSSVKATVDSLRLPTLNNFPIIVPIYDEQKEISSIFSNLEDNILIFEMKLRSVHLVKKSLLQKMFI